ncbi:DUF5808 domain-containing protein [Clostridium akagii]|uniref:DUF5808 domain-containing protein n=1 Tax=Clostridium akagii TaxID=91623 RepID=UPI003BF9E045
MKEYRKIKGAFHYYNKEDSNFVVPKLYGIAWTVNLANPISCFFVLAVIIFIVWSIFFK